MPMAKKRSSKKKAPKEELKAEAAPADRLTIGIPEGLDKPMEEEPRKEPEEEPEKDSGGLLRMIGILVVLVAVAALAFVMLVPQARFVPGPEVDKETFLELFDSAGRVIVVMDVRGVSDDITRRNILQCGVDFAGSSGLAPKNATYFSFGDVGCVTPDGETTDQHCMEEMKDAFVIYVHEGGATTYHSRGVMVGVSAQYDLGTCGIHRIQ